MPTEWWIWFGVVGSLVTIISFIVYLLDKEKSKKKKSNGVINIRQNAKGKDINQKIGDIHIEK